MVTVNHAVYAKDFRHNIFFIEQYILHYLSRKPLHFLVNQVRVGVVNLYTLMDIFKEKPEHLCIDGSLCNVNDLPIGQYIMAVF